MTYSKNIPIISSHVKIWKIIKSKAAKKQRKVLKNKILNRKKISKLY